MYQFWDQVIHPILSASRAKRLVEIGSEEGDHTLKLLWWATARRGVLHVIDPKPLFDAARLARAHPKTLVIHETLSVDALPGIKRPDAVLIDGDHNWYTVRHELGLLEEISRRWPITFLHDIGWPYGRRDMYYDPETVPAEFRHPYERSGVLPGRSALSPDGMSPSHAHATHEGGPRNGVLTAVEDFLDESERNIEFFAMRGTGGLGLLIERQQLKKTLGAVVKRLHDPDFARLLSPDHPSRYFE